MNSDRPTVAALGGDPAGWPALLRDLIRFVADASPAEAAVLTWLCEHTAAADREEAAQQLAFLDRVSVLEPAGETISPGQYGREYLDTHDEDVLYEGLAAGAAEFASLVDALAVRPLTDAELMDLLGVEFDAEFDSPAVVRPHRQWLQAVGYLRHEDGVNELTRSGRRAADADGLSTPASPEPPVTGLAEPSPEVSDTDAGGPSAPRALGPGADLRAQLGPGSPDRTEARRSGGEAPSRRDDHPDDAFAGLRERYDDTCMLCGDRRRQAPGEGLSLIYHPMSVDADHGGPETAANALVVCPNHYADLAHGLVRIDPRTLEVTHAYETDLSGRPLRAADGHEPGAEYLAYHNQVVAEEF